MLPRLTYIVLRLLLLQHVGFAQQRGTPVFSQYNIKSGLVNRLLATKSPMHVSNVPAPQNGKRDSRFAGRILSLPFNGMTNANCIDTSVRLIYNSDSNWIANDYLTKTRDGNILLPGWTYNNNRKETDAHLIKCTPQGDTLWSISIKGGYYNSFMDVYRAFELNDGSILLTGDVDVPMPVNGRSDFMMTRVSATGNLIWEKTFATRLWDADTTNGSIDIYDCKQDAAGNLYLGGDVRHFGPSRAALAFKMDVAGNILWSDGIVLGSVPVITGINLVGNKVSFFGHTFNYENKINCFDIVTDAATGDTLSTKYLVPANGEFYHSFYENGMVKLSNGNLALFGAGGSDNSNYDPTKDVTHAGILEVTPDFNFVRSYLLRTAASSNAYTTWITVFKDGSAAYARSTFPVPYNGEMAIGNFKNGQILRERVIPYKGSEAGWTSNFIQLDDGGQLLTNFFSDDITRKTEIELLRFHNSDTSGSCLGTDTSATFVKQETFYPWQPYVDSVSRDVLNENQRPFIGVFPDHFDISTNCKQISFCDTLHLLSSRDTVCENVPVNIIVQKNKECGAYPFWNYDTSAVSSFYKMNDSTVQVTFGKPWQGFIRSSIEGCKTLEDSVKLTVLVAPATLDIGPDTSICPGNTVVLSAKAGYASYKWQDGSGDSTFTVTQPGTYYVTTMDACGGIFSDTVTVGSHPPISFDIGPDISICANDTATITAPPGFLHYQWTSYNIIPDTGQVVKVFPDMNFMYKLTAEKTPGCFASDSLFVTVKTVPPVHLGNDTSFCANQSAVLDAGSGFDIYAWNTGASTEQIVADKQGIFSVKATLNGCSSFDTMQVLNVYPLPDFSLGNDTDLCEGQLLHYNFNLSPALYKWSTGDSSNSATITQPGIYWLQVTQMGCVNSDTINVKYKRLPVVSLGNDTTVCEKQTLQLNAYNDNASYLWQDGSTAPGYLVKNAGTYSVRVDLNSCRASDTVVISYKALPFFTLGKDSFLCSGQQYILRPVINTNTDLIWQDGSSASSFNVIKDGIYFLTATNECGSYTDSVTITTGFCDIMMPSGFTPNGDGINDVFKVKYPFPLKQFYLVVYDRWGEKVFETNKISEGWDGTSKGLSSPQSTYVWLISFTDIDNKQLQLKGLVTLLR